MFAASSIFGNIVLGIVGIVILIYSAEFVVRKLIQLAHHFGMSDVFIGMTAMSIGTSLPEIGSHLSASFGILAGTLDYKIASSTVLGANIGSDVIQQTLILGIVVFIIGGVTFTKDFLKKNYSMMIATTLITLLLGWDGQISRIDGAILLSIFVWYMYYLYEHDTHHVPENDGIDNHVGVEVLYVIGGMAVLLASSSVVLKVTEFIVAQTGIGGSLIGVMSLGVASALPEMFSAIEGAKKNAKGLSLGTLIGSNITNPLLAIGLGGVISTYFVPKPLIYWDLPMETITAALLLVYLLFFAKNNRLGKAGAIYLMALYAVYAVVRIMFFAVD